jgi:hypothetical protein
MRPSKFKPPKIQELITSCYKPKVPANNICNKLPNSIIGILNQMLQLLHSSRFYFSQVISNM